MRGKPVVSIIIPCYNYGHYMEEALESVLSQTYSDWECIIVNDGSTDHTEQIALSYREKDERFKYLFKQNGGHSSARNLGISKSLGNYILPLDPDDKIADYFLEKAVKVLDENPQIKVLCFQTELFGDEHEIIKMPPYSFRSLLIINYLVNTCMYRKDDFLHTQGYDESMLGFEDWNLWIDILKRGGEVVELPYIGYYYRKKENSVFKSFQKDEPRVFRDQLKLYTNHIDVYSAHFASPIELIQETEKLNRIVSAYQNTTTYRVGKRINTLKSIFKKLFN